MARLSDAASEPNRVWARGFGVTVRPLVRADLEDPGIQRALRDGIERNFEGDLPPGQPAAECYAILARQVLVGTLTLRRDVPCAGAVVFDCVAIVPAHRGHAYGARALMAAERRLRAAAYFARVPRTNGRGLYFMLRCGYAPAAPPAEPDGGATWFRRGSRLAAPAAAGRRRATPRGASG
ncbi:MAG: GNAT family N-acetyltransferase [Dehalococcoidia bacterium]|nr:GNAT family N-acetyltransferase [Dehalococcoidia bacterium]